MSKNKKYDIIKKIYKGNSKDLEKDDEIIIGINPVYEALNSNKSIECIYYSHFKKSMEKIFSLAKELKVPLKQVGREKLQKIDNNNQGIAAKLSFIPFISLDDFFKNLKTPSQDKGEYPLLIICDNISDPRNLGSIIRAAECLGANGVIIPNRRSAPLSPITYKTSAGAASHLSIIKVSNINNAIQKLKEKGFWIYGTQMEGNLVYEVDYNRALAIVLGSEQNGMRDLVKKQCDNIIKIPMKGKTNSLNVASAGAIVMYEILKQRENFN